MKRLEDDRVRAVIYDIGLDREVVLSVMFYTREEWDSPVTRVSPYRRNVEREGVLL